MEDIEKIIPPKIPRELAISLGKLKAKMCRLGGISEDLCGSYQPERSKREDVELGELMEKIVFARCDAVLLEKSISPDLLTEILHYLTMRCSEHDGNAVREVQ